jgi:hypothetical protein
VIFGIRIRVRLQSYRHTAQNIPASAAGLTSSSNPRECRAGAPSHISLAPIQDSALFWTSGFWILGVGLSHSLLGCLSSVLGCLRKTCNDRLPDCYCWSCWWALLFPWRWQPPLPRRTPVASASRFVIATIPPPPNRYQNPHSLPSEAQVAAATIAAAVSPLPDGLTRSSPHPLSLRRMSRLTAASQFRFHRTPTYPGSNPPVVLQFRKPEPNLTAPRPM